MPSPWRACSSTVPISEGWDGEPRTAAVGDAGGGVGCSPPMGFWSRCLDLSWSLGDVCVVSTTPGTRGESCTERSHLQTVASPADTDPSGQGLASLSSSLHGIHQGFQLCTWLVSHRIFTASLLPYFLWEKMLWYLLNLVTSSARVNARHFSFSVGFLTALFGSIVFLNQIKVN